MRGLALFLAAVAILGLLPFTAFAQENASDAGAAAPEVSATPETTNAGQLISPAPTTVQGRLRTAIQAREAHIKQLQAEKDAARDALVTAKAQYKLSKAKLEVLKAGARAYLKRNLLIMKERLQKMSDSNATYDEANSDASFVDDSIAAMDTNLTKEQIVEKAKEIHARWAKIKMQARHAIVLRSLHLTSMITKNAEGLYDRLVKVSTSLKNSGKDTASIDAKLAEYKADVDAAAAAINATTSAYFEGKIYNAIQSGDLATAGELISGANAALKDIRQTQLKAAHDLLKQIAQEIRALLGVGEGGPIKAVAGTGTLNASGTGAVGIHGAGTVAAGGTGTLIVKDVAGDAVIKVRGVGTRHELKGGAIVYRGTGVAYVSGSNVKVLVYGNIKVKASGTGIAVMKGKGTYSAKPAEVESTTAVATTDATQATISGETVTTEAATTETAVTAESPAVTPTVEATAAEVIGGETTPAAENAAGTSAGGV